MSKLQILIIIATFLLFVSLVAPTDTEPVAAATEGFQDGQKKPANGSTTLPA